VERERVGGLISAKPDEHLGHTTSHHVGEAGIFKMSP